MSGGGSAGKSESKSKSSAFTDPAQAPYLEALRSGGLAAMRGMPSMQPQFESAAQGANQLNAMNFSRPDVGGAMGRLNSFSGANPYATDLGDYATRMQADGSPGVDNVISNLGADINRQLQRMLTGAGGANTQSALAGTLGGGRNEVERGILGEGALNSFGTQAGQIRLEDYQQRQAQALQAMQSAGGLYGQGQQQGIDAASAAGQLGLGGSAAELAQGLGLADIKTKAGALGFSPFTNQMSLWQQLAQIIGDPNVLNKAKGSTSSASMSGYGGIT